jgi:hypothetical protein
MQSSRRRRSSTGKVSHVRIFDEVLAFIQLPGSQAALERLAICVFRYQIEHVPAYRDYAKALSVESSAVARIVQIPAVSTLAFKYARMESAGATTAADARLFLTSGTTDGKDGRGRHLLIRPEIYRASALSHLRRMMFPDGRRLAMLALHPTADRMTESSLSQMITWCIEEFGTDVECAATREGLDRDRATAFLRKCEADGAPVCILATTAACASLFSAISDTGVPIRLQASSRLMDTGGAKGQTTPLSAVAVVEQAAEWLGLYPAYVINEYGMTEMCSQLYDATTFNSDHNEAPGARVKLAPPWLRPFTLNPASMRPVADGEVGMMAFFDLANVGSVSMILTEDLGIIRDGTVRILGRAASADARGCALAIEEFARFSS